MSDITPADALRELGDDQAEYAAAAAKKLGLPESVEYVEMRTEYGLRAAGEDLTWSYRDRKHAESIRLPGDTLFVREIITTAWREVTA